MNHRPFAGHEHQAVAGYGLPVFTPSRCVIRWEYPKGHSGGGERPFAWSEIVQTCCHGTTWDDAHTGDACALGCLLGDCDSAARLRDRAMKPESIIELLHRSLHLVAR